MLVFERAYRAFLDVLEGDGLVDGITVVDGEITVNFLPVVADGLQALQRFGLLDDVTIPELTREGDPSQQIADLEQALGRDLSDDFAQIVVYRSDSLASAGETVDRVQQVLILVKRSFPLILAVTIIGLVGSVLLARQRRRAILILLLSSAATFVVARALVSRVLDEVPSIARTPAGQAAVAASTSALADGLVKAFGVGVVLFLLAALMTSTCSTRERRTAQDRCQHRRRHTRGCGRCLSNPRVVAGLRCRAARDHARRVQSAVGDRALACWRRWAIYAWAGAPAADGTVAGERRHRSD